MASPSQGSGVPPYRAVDANWQLIGHVRLYAPFTVLRSMLLFVLAALAEIGGAWLVWQGVREHRGLAFVGAGILALGAYGFVATFQPDPHFGRILPTRPKFRAHPGRLRWGCSWPARLPGVWPSMASVPTATTWSAPPCA
jgi:small multidrug resistance family-3 protein